MNPKSSKRNLKGLFYVISIPMHRPLVRFHESDGFPFHENAGETSLNRLSNYQWKASDRNLKGFFISFQFQCPYCGKVFKFDFLSERIDETA